MANRLANATSPYLLQHAENPVDWWEWGPEAFAEAKRRGTPILLSVGYAACHWCHVMAHESFEDAGVADVLNDGFVAIKVDREERPDIDAIYMAATTAMTGHGGWPMTCLLTPQAEPFWCGTYLSRTAFRQLLDATTAAWTAREDEVRSGGAHVAQVLGQAAAAQRDVVRPIGEEDLAAAAAALVGSADPRHGGFGGAPKFPPSMVLQFLLRHLHRTGDDRVGQVARAALHGMARGGIYDQLGGGFARYAMDAGWVVPHFEKMLYDNAQLIRAYTAGAVSADLDQDTRELCRRVVAETVQFLLDDLATDQGAFASSLDADTGGVEGSTYVWTQSDLVEVLGAADGLRAAEFLTVTDEGTFEHGTSTLQRQVADPDDERWWPGVRERLRRARAERPQPGRDDKVVTAWNGLAVAALAEAGWRFDQPAWIQAAVRAAQHVLDTHLVDGRLRRSSLGGEVGAADAVAEDHGNLLEGLIILHLATADTSWLDRAGELLEDAIELYRVDTDDSRGSDGSTPPPTGAFADTAADAEGLLWRPAARTDNAEPCGQSALAGALLAYGTAAGSPEHLDLAVRATARMGEVVRADPRFAGWVLTVAESAVQGPLQVALSTGADQAALARAARQLAPPGALVIAAPEMATAEHSVPDEPGGHLPPLLRARGPVHGHAAAYICRGTVCDLPVTTPTELAAGLVPARPDPTRVG